MRKGLFISAAGLLLAGSGTAYGACTPVLDCTSLGYKYSSAECSGNGVACPFDTSKYFCAEPCTYTVTKATCDSQCKNVGDNACMKNGTVYYEACGSSKCETGYTCTNGSCTSTCNYSYTAASCSSQCKNVGDNACMKNGTVYYEACGSSKCGTGYTCTNGSCTSTCNYSYTAAICSSQCKNVGSTSCVKDGTTYYSSCGSSLCSSSQTCSNGTCTSNVATNGYCCDDTESYCSYYSYCKRTYGYYDCSDMTSSCEASGGSPVFQGCGNKDKAIFSDALFSCH